MTAAGLAGPSGGARREVEGNRPARPSLAPGLTRRGLGSPAPSTSPAPPCPWCDRPRDDTANTDPQHAPCLAAAQRMDRDLAAQRQTKHHLASTAW